MTRIAVIGGTGYAGSHIVREAVERGHTAVSIARSVPDERVEHASYLEGTIIDVPGLLHLIEGAEVVVVAVAPRGDMAGKMRECVAMLVAALPEDVRVGVIGGAGGSLVAPGGPRLVDTDGFPDAIADEAREVIGVLEDLRRTPTERDWFYVHPAAGFGSFAPGERTGSYRTGGEVLVANDEGESVLSGADLGVAVIDEIETPRHRRERFTVGY